MKNRLLGILKTVWPYILTLLLGLYLAEILTGSILSLSKYKLTFADHMPDVLKGLALHPIHYYTMYLAQKNPSLIIISVAVVLYTAYFALKQNSKNKPWETADTDTHGSATWGDIKDLMEHFFRINEKDLTRNFNQETNADVLNSLIERESKSRIDKK
ncbi:conjugal transfer protein [Oenococcus oeni]|uniref:conjugal transfer protein n=1 Tax=Oenococcus oeni TaxID=1247 RepID=UPI0010BA3328|nr:conjugal transfer protein [Oenococcus oeni]SYW14941.1 Conjugation protein [Oenococcus oeni]